MKIKNNKKRKAKKLLSNKNRKINQRRNKLNKFQKTK